MKKIISLLFVLVLLVGCSSNDKVSLANMSAEEQYNVAQQTMKNVTDLEAKIIMDIHMSDAQQTTTQTTEMMMKMSDMNSLEKMAAEITTNVEGTDMTMYIKDGYFYMDIMGAKLKTSLTEDLQNQYVGQLEVAEYDPNVMMNLASKKTEQGYLLSYEMNEVVLNEAMAQSLYAMQEQIPNSDLVFKKAKGSMLIDEDAMTKQVIVSIEMELFIEDLSMGLAMDMTMDYLNTNNVTIDFPADLEEYQEY